MDLEEKSICFVIPHFVTFSTGGAEIQVHYLTQAFLQRGWNVEVVCAGLGKEPQMQSSVYYNKNIKYHYYRKKTIRTLEFFDVLKVLKNTNSNYYYQRTDFALTAATYLFAKKNKRKMVYALAGDEDTHKNKYTITLKSTVYSSIVKKWMRGIDFFLLDKLIEYTKRRVEYVVCQNQYQYNTYKANFGISPNLIPNSFIADDNVGQEKQNVVLWVGNNHPTKQPGLFVKLANQMLGSGWEFVMIGSACSEIDKDSVPENLKLLGPVAYELANQWFAKAKVFVNTSLYEGMPNTFIQSWYFNTLVMSLNVDPDAVFSKTKAGYCFAGDLDKMKEELQNLMAGKPIEETLKNGKAYFEEKFDINRNVDVLIEYIRSCI